VMLKPTTRVAESLGADGEQREAIMAAVRADLDRVGYRRIRLEDVARHAGVSRQTIYDYFGSRDGLIRAFMAQESVRLAEVIAQAITEERDPRRGFTKGLSQVLAWLADRPSLQDPLREDFVVFTSTRGQAVVEYTADMAAAAFRESLGADRRTAVEAGSVFARLLYSFIAAPQAGSQDAARIIGDATWGVLGR
jgi:AcrR family transcriptional regulator